MSYDSQRIEHTLHGDAAAITAFLLVPRFANGFVCGGIGSADRSAGEFGVIRHVNGKCRTFWVKNERK
jgi:ABC-type molybdate transport system permease subunit